MVKNFFKIAFRNLVNNKVYSFINIAGLVAGMTVALLIGLWVRDELNFNKSIEQYDRIGKVWQFVKFGNIKSSYDVSPMPLGVELRQKYPEFAFVSLSSNHSVVLSAGEKKLMETGNYVEPEFAQMMSLKMINGNQRGLNDIHSILISGSLAKALFADQNPINQLMRLNDTSSVKVTGVFEDFPANSSFYDVHFLAAWDLYEANESWVMQAKDNWDNNSFNILVQLKSGADFKNVSARIKDIRMKRNDPPAYKPEFFLQPMSRWHLYSDFYDGVNTGGMITYVWLFGIIGIFVLLLACINFMNLSTARSEKRAKEVGIRKTIGSRRWQLIGQFFSESVLYVLIAFFLALLVAILMLPFFNQVSGKQISISWASPAFWITGFSFSLFTALVAGSYPALYLSGFEPVKVLKGTFKAGRFAALPRKILVVLQFTVSVSMIIGTIVIYRQIQFVKNRPIGYNQSRLIEMNMNTKALYGHYDALRAELLKTGAVENVSESSGSVTEQYGGTTDMSWTGKTIDQHPLVMSNVITPDYGKTVGWQLTEGRDFSRIFATDSSSIILNESALKLMAFKNPLGEMIKTRGGDYRVIGIIKDMIKESPFQQVKPSFFILDNNNQVNVVNIKLAARAVTGDALSKIEKLFKKYDPASPFSYTFVDQQYAAKFSDQEKISKLAGFFTMLAIFISCLGLFGLASFVAEQRTKEIGVRKILGASVLNVWGLLSKEFIILVGISLLIATPLAYYSMHKWLQGYEYRAELSWWIFAAVGASAILITLLTVSFQAIKAAVANPVNSLRSE
jgi:putative ABC transport system permease protein